MFTGIVSAVGSVTQAGGGRLGVEHAATARRLRVGSSVAVNGCCLTVVKKTGNVVLADLVPETLRRTNLGTLNVGAQVNLELPLTARSPLDGHIVQGHIDGTGTVQTIDSAGAGRELTITLPPEMERFVVEKGSIAVDGMSLTIVAVDAGSFKIALIPHTLAVTIAGAYAAGSVVNLEADVVARYVARNLRQ